MVEVIIRVFDKLGDAENFTYVLFKHGIKAELVKLGDKYGLIVDKEIDRELLEKLRKMSVEEIRKEMIKIRRF